MFFLVGKGTRGKETALQHVMLNHGFVLGPALVVRTLCFPRGSVRWGFWKKGKGPNGVSQFSGSEQPSDRFPPSKSDDFSCAASNRGGNPTGPLRTWTAFAGTKCARGILFGLPFRGTCFEREPNQTDSRASWLSVKDIWARI